MPLQIISVITLITTSLLVIFNLRSRSGNTHRTVLPMIALLFLFPALAYLLPESDANRHGVLLAFSYSLENTVAYVLLIVLFWGLAMLSETGLATTVISIIVAATLFAVTWDPKWRPLQSVFRSFCVLFAMMIATFALIRRQQNGIWLVLALMSLAFSLKPQLLSPLINPFESHNYLKAIAIFCIGRAISVGPAPLFKNRR